MNKMYADIRKEKIDIKKNANIGRLTTFKIGGKADALARVKNARQLCALIKILNRYRKKYFIAGNLSNVLVSDSRIRKVFIMLEGRFKQVEITGKNTVYAGSAVKAGVMLGKMAEAGLGGLEFLAGIPGTVGGAVYMNAGAYGRGIGKYIISVDVVDGRGNGKTLKKAGKMFGYRSSMFQKNGDVITGIRLRAKKRGKRAVQKELIYIVRTRHKKHPWKACCAGSFIKNGSNFTAAKLIEGAGMKGKKAGGAMVSLKHANFIVNTGKAKFSDVIRLSNMIKKAVYKKYRIKLKEEVRIIK